MREGAVSPCVSCFSFTPFCYSNFYGRALMWYINVIIIQMDCIAEKHAHPNRNVSFVPKNIRNCGRCRGSGVLCRKHDLQRFYQRLHIAWEADCGAGRDERFSEVGGSIKSLCCTIVCSSFEILGSIFVNYITDILKYRRKVLKYTKAKATQKRR